MVDIVFFMYTFHVVMHKEWEHQIEELIANQQAWQWKGITPSHRSCV